MFKSDENSYYGILPLGTNEFDDSLTLKSLPEFPACSKRLGFKDYYQADTFLVKKRLRKSFFVSGDNFFEEDLPDVYCTFWIPTTLNLVLFFFCVHSDQSYAGFACRALVIYAVILIAPGVIYFLYSGESAQSIPSTFSYTHLLSAYSYSFLHFLIPTLLAFQPYKTLTLLLYLISLLTSLLFLKSVLWPSIKSTLPKQKFSALSICLFFHFTIGLVLTQNILN